MKKSQQTRSNPNPAGPAGKPIILPPTTFEDAVTKMLNTPALPQPDRLLN